MTCNDFFKANADVREYCKELQKIPEVEVLAFEMQTAAPGVSPGPVLDEEILLRQMINPTHYDAEKNQYKATAFSDVSSRGASVNRASHAEHGAVLMSALDRVAKIDAKGATPAVKFLQLVELRCSEIRQIRTDILRDGTSHRGFVVLDTATSEDKSHADICQIVSQPAHSRSVRSALVEIANRYLLEHPVAAV